MPHPAEIIAASPDLRNLYNDSFEIAIKEAHLFVSGVPYLSPQRTVQRGILIFPLSLASGTVAGKPPDHVAFFAGDYPHYADGTPIKGIVNEDGKIQLTENLVVRFRFSSKPDKPDENYEVKVRRYVALLSDPARVIDPTVTAQTRKIIESEESDSPLVFPDTNSARAQITAVTNKLKGLKFAIIGLGGTGSYILDLIAKTPVKEIHLYDDDEYSLHNSYRSPGAPTRDQLNARMLKVNYLKEIYGRFHRGVIAHPERIDVNNVAKLEAMDFVFTSIDPGPDKASLVNFLVSHAIPFCDTGLGVELAGDTLVGLVNTITVTPKHNSHAQNVPTKAGGDDALYASNIQIAELNSMNAALAVIRCKKYFGVYRDDRHEHECSYTISPNMLTNEETHS